MPFPSLFHSFRFYWIVLFTAAMLRVCPSSAKTAVSFEDLSSDYHDHQTKQHSTTKNVTSLLKEEEEEERMPDAISIMHFLLGIKRGRLESSELQASTSSRIDPDGVALNKARFIANPDTSAVAALFRNHGMHDIGADKHLVSKFEAWKKEVTQFYNGESDMAFAAMDAFMKTQPTLQKAWKTYHNEPRQFLAWLVSNFDDRVLQDLLIKAWKGFVEAVHKDKNPDDLLIRELMERYKLKQIANFVWLAQKDAFVVNPEEHVLPMTLLLFDTWDGLVETERVERLTLEMSHQHDFLNSYLLRLLLLYTNHRKVDFPAKLLITQLKATHQMDYKKVAFAILDAERFGYISSNIARRLEEALGVQLKDSKTYRGQRGSVQSYKDEYKLLHPEK
ncbi:unnamed protein product [Peronospora belbahrii]|uniref:RxLR effector candidate protein n=1 Tax=Peronospora belbahrii TaxID=622444 RepID=A0AAU9KM42_9STRA|nr:unnamed protein product [Peronospora belbahrii]